MMLSEKPETEFIGTMWLVPGGAGSAAIADVYTDVGIGWLAPVAGAILAGIVYPGSKKTSCPLHMPG